MEKKNVENNNVEVTENKETNWKLKLYRWTNSYPLIGRRGISGSTLKILAIILMTIDHVGAGLVLRYCNMLMSSYQTLPNWKESYDHYFEIYQQLRWIGRFSFPIFVFLIVEGFKNTGNIWKYMKRLAIFAILSEVPFDLCFFGKVMDFQKQNVFFELLLGVFMMKTLDELKDRMFEDGRYLVVAVLFPILAAALAEGFFLDYGFFGIMSILIVYLASRNRLLQLLTGSLSFLWEMPAPLGFLPIIFYNGERGLKLKYIFYLFYPLHLLAIAYIAYKMGIFEYVTLIVE